MATMSKLPGILIGMSRVSTKPKFAKRSLGQNFLVDLNYIEKIIAAVDIQADETVVEIGPGRGSLTERLVETGASVIAVELDRNFVPFLKEKFAAEENFWIIEADALEVDFVEIIKPATSAKLVANLPYNISTAILQRLIDYRPIFSEMILMFQREVVDRITAKPADSDRGYLSVLTEAYFDITKLFDVPPNAFKPVPKVWSSVVRIRPKNIQFENEKVESVFLKLISAGFRQRRKTIQNNLKTAPDLHDLFAKHSGLQKVLIKSGFDPSSRAEAISLEQWIDLASQIT